MNLRKKNMKGLLLAVFFGKVGKLSREQIGASLASFPYDQLQLEMDYRCSSWC